MSARLGARLLALGVLLAVLAAAVAGIGWPLWVAYAEQGERIDEQHRLLAQYRRIAAGSAALERQVQSLKQWQARSNLYLRASTEALAAAELQSLVKQQASVRGGRVLSAQTLAGKQEGGFTRVAVKVRVRTDMAGMLQTLHGLESRRPLLFIDELSIRSLTSRRRDPVSGALLDLVDLDMTIQVSGYMREPAT